ncbi:HIT family protein [Candidatus Woesearchaeota archaeon]|nr:HIT family protein [Candidatus Woesearchaeota archaeon]
MVQLTQEQAQAMQEKLKNMSPEELKEFQKKQCIFCQIISGKVASKKIYSDDKCTAILDINPANPGHILLLPNEHYSIMPLIPAEELSHLFKMAKALAHASLKALEAQGTNIFIANGVAAGQKAQHFMIHIIPRKEGDNVNLGIPEKSISKADTKKVIERLKPAIAKALGKGIEEEPGKKAEEKEDAHKAEKEEPAPEEEKFITSAKARRFHKNECPFAQKIPEDSRIYRNHEEMGKIGKLPCSCTKLKTEEEEKKKPAKKKQESGKKTAKKKEKAGEKQEPQGEEGITLDDISSLLTGGAG